MSRQSNNPLQFGLENMRREVQCYKEMYELANQKQASILFILSDIIKKGFNAAAQGYLQVINNKNYILHIYVYVLNFQAN